MEITDIQLDFLWLTKGGPILDAPDPFWEKWRKEKLKLSNFIKTESIPKLIQLIVTAYKDQYPRSYWGGGILLDLENYAPKEEEGYVLIESSSMIRKDIKKIKKKHYTDNEDLSYLSELIYEFTDSHELEVPIETILEGKVYEKVTNVNVITYTVEESPIAQLVITPQSFKLIVNEAYFVYLSL
ncbi:hypothetical protein GCM10011344_24970 [Dokdonia pacifica]|uniref:Uncharacterized protein n=1 Tax=Dokdonia pacifica TaxID=1627892 RepID=A0A238WQR3_9FLAO|nr:hypothetical protein [Dokdonia pacifica]GGG23229.1 hypothetical protein GCM10011344_24970 [Dokdonia pacifica]SNR48748.1 hypothetical protein SAMN06265376_1011327 [Dokdonia pacifica]